MIDINNKVILTDVDGVLLDWGYAFDSWMNRHGYKIKGELDNYSVHVRYKLQTKESKRLVRMFNESAWMRKLPPFRDSIKWVKKLHEEHGYVFHAITSQTDDQYAGILRIKNLREMFGTTVFEKYTILDTGADKDEALKVYENTEVYWIEDKPENVDTGLNLGLRGILMNHDYNKSYEGSAYQVNNWKEIYNMIVGE
jgi:FMN phosphatase YigB (HAD superfamily)